MTKITVKCVDCGFEKDVGPGQMEVPMCDKCYSVMLPKKAEYNPKKKC